MIGDPTKGTRAGPSKDIELGDSHSGEGLASVRDGLRRSIANSARRTAERKQEPAASVPAPLIPEPSIVKTIKR